MASSAWDYRGVVPKYFFLSKYRFVCHFSFTSCKCNIELYNIDIHSKFTISPLYLFLLRISLIYEKQPNFDEHEKDSHQNASLFKSRTNFSIICKRSFNCTYLDKLMKSTHLILDLSQHIHHRCMSYLFVLFHHHKWQNSHSIHPTLPILEQYLFKISKTL